MIKRLFCFLLIFFFLISNSFAKENFILNWDKLIPLNAYDFVPETERYSAIKVDRVATDETNSKPSDFFKSGDANGANYTASLYEIKPAAKGLPPTYELHSQLNTGDYTAQSRVVFKRVEE